MKNKLSSNEKQNILTAFLSLLKVRYTSRYANNLYNEHPYKHSLFGLSNLLNEYNIRNAGIKILDKTNGITDSEAPFIAHAGDEFILVYKKDTKKVQERIHFSWIF